MPLDSATFTPKVPTFDLTTIKKQVFDAKAQAAKAQTTGAADGTDQPAGAGSAAGTNTAPDVNSTNVAVAVASMMVALGSLDDLMPKGLDSGDALDVDLAAILAKLKKTNDDVDKGKINTDAEAKKAALDAQKKALTDAQTKSDEAAQSAKHVSLADKFKLAFTWIGAIVAVVVAAVLIATGVGAAVGVALIAAAVIAIAMAVDQTMQMANQASGKNGGLSMFGMMFQQIGKDAGLSGDKLAAFTAKATMGLNMALMVVSIALSFADPEGAENAVTEAVEVGPNMAKLGEDATAAEKMVATIKDVGVSIVESLKGMVEDMTTGLKSAKNALSTMKEEGVVKQVDKVIEKLQSLLSDLKSAGQKGIAEIKTELKAVLDDLKSAKNMLKEMNEDGPAKTLEKAGDKIQALLKALKDEGVGEVKDFFNEVKAELDTMHKDGIKYLPNKLKEAFEEFKDSLTVEDKAGNSVPSASKIGVRLHNENKDLQKKSDTVTTTVADVNQYKADKATGESKVASGDAKMDEAIAKAISADIDMLLASMKKHGEAFDAQIDQVMDGMRSHQQSLTRHVA